MKKNDWIKLVVSVVICLGAGFIGSFSTASNIPVWYSGLVKPSFNPPNWLFGPVWTVLYIMMGVSFFLVWKSTAEKKTSAILVFIVQLMLNTLWTLIFFGMKQVFLAFIEIAILWLLILLTIILFMRISRTAAYLLLPYLLWVSFASVLNFMIYKLN